MATRTLFGAGWFGLALVLACPAAAAPFELHDGDRVVMIGSTVIEREAAEGYIETRLTAAYPGRRIMFRNLGWSGDTVWGHARAGFDTEVQGFERLVAHVKSLEPTVLIVGYGNVESFAGAAGRKNFSDGLERLLNQLELKQTRLVYLSPSPHEALPAPLPDATAHNGQLSEYSLVIHEAALRRGGRFVDLLNLLNRPPGAARFTDNGIHLTPYGYWQAATAIAYALESPQPNWRIDVDLTQGAITASGMQLHQLSTAVDGCQFAATDLLLTPCLPPESTSPHSPEIVAPARLLRVAGLSPGAYALQMDGEVIAVALAQEWAQGVALTAGPPLRQAEELRTAIREKNELYFHRWRPQNDTYLFGFRKHEQGNNAVEVSQFDPLVAEKEQQIAALAVPRKHEFQLIPAAKVALQGDFTATIHAVKDQGSASLATLEEVQP